ncbi:MAG: hypothetical protein R3B90_15510 [Planctomycetaceae bacterium]
MRSHIPRSRRWPAIGLLGLLLLSAGCQSMRLPWSSSEVPKQWEPDVETAEVDE